MRSQIWNRLREHLGLSLKCGSVLFLFLISVLVVACGATNTAQVPGAPPVTVTINLDQTFSSPTPKLAEYSCGAWVTESTPAYSPTGIVQAFAKFVHNVDGNPVGVGGVGAAATVRWPGGSQTQINATTTSDGLAVFPVPLQAYALNHVVLIDVSFQAPPGGQPCSTTSPAFFTAIEVSPTASPSPSDTPSPSGTSTCTPGVIPTFPPLPGVTVTPKPTRPPRGC